MNQIIQTSKPLPIIFGSFNQCLIYQNQQLRKSINEVENNIMLLEQLTNQPRSSKKEVVLNYLPKEQAKQQEQPAPQLQDLESNIDEILIKVIYFKIHITKNRLSSNSNQQKMKLKQFMTIINHRKQQKLPQNLINSQSQKLLKRKVQRDNLVSILKQQQVLHQSQFENTKKEVMKPQTQTKGNKLPPTNNQKNLKQQQQLQSQQQVQPQVDIVQQQPVQQQQQQSLQNQQIQDVKAQQQKQIMAKDDLKSNKLEQKKFQLKSFSYDNQDDMFKNINIKLLYDFGRVKKESDKKIDEFSASFNFYREKEQKARSKFLTKVYQHGKEKCNIYEFQQNSQKKDQEEDEIILTTLKSKEIISPMTESIKLINSYHLTLLLIIQFAEYLTQQISNFLEKFDERLLTLLKKSNKNNVLKQKDLLEIFRKWNQMTFFKENSNQLLTILQNTENIQPIIAVINQVLNWMKPKYIHNLVEKENKKIEACQYLQQINWRIQNEKFEIEILQLPQPKINIRELQKFNILMRQKLLYGFIIHCVIPIVQKTKKDQQTISKLMNVIKCLLSQVYFKGSVRVSAFSKEDVNECYK